LTSSFAPRTRTAASHENEKENEDERPTLVLVFVLVLVVVRVRDSPRSRRQESERGAGRDAAKTNRTIGFGESTDDEMCFNFALYYPSGALTCGAGGLGREGPLLKVSRPAVG
jgi:hypothetical protein